MSREEYDQDQPPFEPTGMTDFTPAVIITETDVTKLLAMWCEQRTNADEAMHDLRAATDQLAGIEDAIRKARPKAVKEIGRHLRRVIDDRKAIEGIADSIKTVEYHLQSIFKAMAAESGIDKFPTGYVTVSVKDDVSTKYDPAAWDSIIAHLIGVNFDDAEMNALFEASERGDKDAIEKAIRACIWTGDLGCLQRRFTTSKVVDISAGERGLPAGLSLETIPGGKVSVSRVAGSMPADQLPTSL